MNQTAKPATHQWQQLQWQWVQQQKHWPHPHCRSPVRFLPPHFTNQEWRKHSWAGNVIQFKTKSCQHCCRAARFNSPRGWGFFLGRFCMFFGFFLHLGIGELAALTWPRVWMWAWPCQGIVWQRRDGCCVYMVCALVCMWPKCHLVASSFLSACRGAVFGTLQGNRSRGCSRRFAARVCSGSAESRTDCSAVWKELCRWRDQVRNEDLLEVVVMNTRSWWRFCCSLCVVVEDVSSSACVTVKVFPYMTVAALKQQVRETLSQTVNDRGAAGFPSLTPSLLPQVFFEYGFHPRVQRWVIGQCLCTEPRSLASYGVQKDGDTAYLYLISARQARVTRQLFQQDLEGALLAPPIPPGNGPTSQEWRGYSTLPSRLNHSSQGAFTICKHFVASFTTDTVNRIVVDFFWCLMK